MDNIFEKNLQALKEVNPFLEGKIRAIESNMRFEVFQGSIPYDTNILDTQTQSFLYNNPTLDMADKISEYEKYRSYDFLYFYGIGNGFLYKQLLDGFSSSLQRIVVVEPNTEMIYVALNLVDFSREILRGKLVIAWQEQFDFGNAIDLFTTNNSRIYAKVFEFLAHCSYYEEMESHKEASDVILKALEHVIMIAGNDVIDSLVGIDQHIANMQRMVENPKFADLLKKKNSDIAVIVATGPSLNKQLELLKEIKDKVLNFRT